MNYVLINNQKDLDFAIEVLKLAKILAIDTEFNREDSYYPKLSLLQICHMENQAFVIDALSDINLNKLIDVIYNKEIVKIFHACNQDLEIFYNLYGELPKNIFDTQIAYLFLHNYKDISYEKMVQGLLNIKIDKKLRNSNWDIRPLTQKQIAYAAFDVLYLYNIYHIMINDLNNHSNHYILKNVFKDLENSNRYRPKIDQIFNKLSIGNYPIQEQEFAYLLIKWREDLSKELNINKNLILNNQQIKDIIKIKDINDKKLINIVNKTLALDYINNIVELFNNAKNNPNQNIIATIAVGKNYTYYLIKMIISHLAEKHSIGKDFMFFFIINNNEIQEISNTYNIEALKDWRYDIIGSTIEKFFLGKLSISMNNQKINITEC